AGAFYETRVLDKDPVLDGSVQDRPHQSVGLGNRGRPGSGAVVRAGVPQTDRAGRELGQRRVAEHWRDVAAQQDLVELPRTRSQTAALRQPSGGVVAKRDVSRSGVDPTTAALVGQLSGFEHLGFLTGAERPLVLPAVRRAESDVVDRAAGA